MKFSDTNSGVCTPGFKACGVREGKTGVAVIYSQEKCDCAGVFTRNSVKAAPVIVTKGKLGNGLHAIIVNSGNANACVEDGEKDANTMCEITAKNLEVPVENVAVASTGIIGKPLEVNEINTLTGKACRNLECTPEKSIEAAKAIMTTDTKHKIFSAKKGEIEVGGIAKGAGMIAPNMATMLCFLTSNADISGTSLQECLESAVSKSFNMISVDGDESTNDTVMIMTNKKVECTREDFQNLLDYVCTELSKQVAYDGEGATKAVEFSVSGAVDDEAACKAVLAVLSSPLVKTAIYGENPNWGRILTKLGSVLDVDYRLVKLSFSDGVKTAFALHPDGECSLSDVAEILKSSGISIKADLGVASGKAVGWGCDMSPDYVKINAEYN